MEVHLCYECIETGIKPVSYADITNKSFAPWNEPQVKSLYGYQDSTSFFPFVCNKGHKFSVSSQMLYCLQCDQHQKWAYDWTLDWSWKNYEDGEDDSLVKKNPRLPSDDTSKKLHLPDKWRAIE